MALSINTNMASLKTQTQFGQASKLLQESVERLSSGYKINKAADDASGIAISTKLLVKSASLSKAIENGNEAAAMLQTAEGGMDQISNILTRLKAIATKSASSNTTERAALDVERGLLHAEIDKIAANTTYGTQKLLVGGNTLGTTGASLTASNGISSIKVDNATVAATTTFTLTVALNAGTYDLTLDDGANTQTINVGAAPTGFNTATANFTTFGIEIDVNSQIVALTGGTTTQFTVDVAVGGSSFEFALGDRNTADDKIGVGIGNFKIMAGSVLADLVGQKIDTQANAQTYLNKLDDAVDKLTTERGKLGAAMNQISYQVANIETMNENTISAVSVIKDTDIAGEMSKMTSNQIKTQVGIAMLAQVNQIPQMVLQLLQ